MEIFLTPHFIRKAKKLPVEIQGLLQKQVKIFVRDCFDARLKTHKLTGELKGCWSFSVNYSVRVLFVFEDGETVAFVDIGDHSIYK